CRIEVGYRAGVFALIELALDAIAQRGDLRNALRSCGHDGARIQPAAEEGADRDICDQLSVHRFFQLRSQLLARFVRPDSFRRTRIRPVAPDGGLAIPEHEPVAGPEWSLLPEDASVRMHVELAQEV